MSEDRTGPLPLIRRGGAPAAPRLPGVPNIKPAYLVSGDDDAKIDAWRARLRHRAEEEGGPAALEVFDATASAPGDVASSMAALTLASANRYLLVEHVEAWRADDLEPIERQLADMAEATVLVLITRGKAPARLAKAVAQAGGELRHLPAPKPWQMPRWVAERAKEEGLDLDAEAAQALVSALGPRQQRLAREIEKLGLTAHPRATLTAEEVEQLAAAEVSFRAHDLADALVARDAEAALSLAEELRERDEPPGRLLFAVVRRLRDVHRAAELLEGGLPEQAVRKELSMPPWVAKRTVAQAGKASVHALGRALSVLAELELELRGGSELDEDTALTLGLVRAAA